MAAADDHDDSPGPPVALLPVVLQALQDSPTAGSKERLERHEAFQQEPEDDWSEGMEQALNQFVAAQPEADGLQSQIACRVTQCEVQLFDTKPSISPDHMTRSSVVINRIIRQPWMTTLQLSDMEAGVYKHMTFTLLFLQRRSQQ